MAASTRKVCDCFYKVLNIKKPTIDAEYPTGRSTMSRNYVLLKNHFERIKTTFDTGEYELITQLLDKAFLVLNEESTEKAYRKFGEKEGMCFGLLHHRRHSCDNVASLIGMVESLFAGCQTKIAYLNNEGDEDEEEKKTVDNEYNSINSEEYHSFCEDYNGALETYYSTAEVLNSPQHIHPTAIKTGKLEQGLVADNQESINNLNDNSTNLAICVDSAFKEGTDTEVEIDSAKVKIDSSKFKLSYKSDNYPQALSSPPNDNSHQVQSNHGSTHFSYEASSLEEPVYSSMSPLFEQHVTTMDKMIPDSSRMTKQKDSSTGSLSTCRDVSESYLQALEACQSTEDCSSSNTLSFSSLSQSTPKAKICSPLSSSSSSSSSPSSSSKSKSPFISFREAKKFFPYLSTLSSSSSQSDSNGSNGGALKEDFTHKATSDEESDVSSISNKDATSQKHSTDESFSSSLISQAR